MTDDIEPSYYWNDAKRALNEFLAERFRDCDRAGFNRRQQEVDALKARIAELTESLVAWKNNAYDASVGVSNLHARITDLESRVLPVEIVMLLDDYLKIIDGPMMCTSDVQKTTASLECTAGSQIMHWRRARK